MTTEQLVRLTDAQLERLHARALERCGGTDHGRPTPDEYPCCDCFIAEVKETRGKLPHPNHNRAPQPTRRKP